ncbi:MAG: hypothetical protein HXY23_07170 [Parvularculaceae bacterium]|jgi:hypothetical protein|nr:hypothetical protein [Parvularculaceae bacterium]
MLAADNWCVKVENRIYGPYSSQQLRKFAHEGRFAASSLVAPAGSRTFKEAASEPVFAAFFGIDAKAGGQPQFGKRADPEPKSEKSEKKSAIARKSPDAEPSVANFLIIFDVVSAAASRAEGAILSLGPAFRLNENVWTVACELTALGVRNAIAPYLMPRDSIFVVDATRGRSSWQNFSPEIHAKLAAAWSGARQ